jgi:hypothetical protein
MRRTAEGSEIARAAVWCARPKEEGLATNIRHRFGTDARPLAGASSAPRSRFMKGEQGCQQHLG